MGAKTIGIASKNVCAGIGRGWISTTPSNLTRAVFVLLFILWMVALAHSQGLGQAPGQAPDQRAPGAGTRPAEPVQLPEGPGKAILEKSCVQCHDLNRVASAGHPRQEWLSTVSMMVNEGATLTNDEITTLTDYLTANFPDKSPKPVLLPGPAEVVIKEWQVPTPGSRPHDPLVGPDGMIWYTGQRADVLGRFDPKTEKFKEFPLPKDTGPHGLVADNAGNIWYTANSGAYVGRLDPKTGAVKQWKMPDPKARDPHTPLFDKRGILFFTLQGANMVGRIDPKSDQVKLITLPTPRSNPYGMVISSKGVPFFCEFGGNRLASIDPDTMELKEYILPNPDARPRRIAITADDVLYYSDFARGYLGRFDPKTGEHKEWPSPSGPKSQPYGITQIKGIIWYSESGVEPNTWVRFDPKTEKFQTWVIPSGGGVVRNVSPTPDGGEVWLATSGVNGIARVTIK